MYSQHLKVMAQRDLFINCSIIFKFNEEFKSKIKKTHTLPQPTLQDDLELLSRESVLPTPLPTSCPTLVKSIHLSGLPQFPYI